MWSLSVILYVFFYCLVVKQLLNLGYGHNINLIFNANA